MKNGMRCFGFLIALFLILIPGKGVLFAQDEGEVQVENGVIRPGEFFWYELTGLEEGQTLSVNLRGTSGNLDPIMGLLGESGDPGGVQEQYQGAIQQAVVDGRDPMMAAQQAADEIFLIWDDDGGEGLAAQFSYVIPADGDYQLIITDAFTVLGQTTSGDYELLIGLDAPQVVSGEATATDASIATLNREASSSGIVVEEIEATIGDDEQSDTFDLHEIRSGDTISILVEATSGDLKPTLTLLNYADKPVSAANMNGQESSAALEYVVEDHGRGFAVRISGCCGEEGSSGEYRLLVGINAPEVLTGEAIHSDERVIKEPIAVAIGLKMQQIVDVNEQNEFFTAAASLQMEWDDPALAFSPDECDCTFKTYTEQNFNEFIADSGGRWPDFTIFNQQGNRWTQNRVLVVWQDGHALYFERFSTDLQVDFDFRQYPFDSEEFIIRVDSIFPETFYYFTDLEGYSEISADHGEDEFEIGEFETTFSSEQASTQATISRFEFSFGGPRHMDYYIIQVFVPILLILGVLWITFFLRDYALRIEVASANLLVFIAFSFSLSDNYPRLGYVTLLDAVMLITFVISALVIVYNVYLRRLEQAGEGELANRIDNVFDWAYPISIAVSGVILYFVFL
jgi:hypothetical protein